MVSLPLYSYQILNISGLSTEATEGFLLGADFKNSLHFLGRQSLSSIENGKTKKMNASYFYKPIIVFIISTSFFNRFSFFAGQMLSTTD